MNTQAEVEDAFAVIQLEWPHWSKLQAEVARLMAIMDNVSDHEITLLHVVAMNNIKGV